MALRRPQGANRAIWRRFWRPDTAGLEPGHEEKEFPDAEKLGALRLIAARDGRNGTVVVHQDVDLYASLLTGGDKLVHDARPGRRAWIQVVRGEVEVNGETLHGGDGAAIIGEERLDIRAESDGEILLFDMP